MAQAQIFYAQQGPSPQERRQQESQRQEEEAAQEYPEPVDTSEIDDLLDEIDSVLEEFAEEFVNGFIQKGGE